MAEFELILPQINEACSFFIEAEFPYYEELREAFWVLKYAGCRPMEIFEINRWSWVNDYNFTLIPQKNNLQRSITLGAECSNFRTCVQNQTAPFLGRTYSQLNYLYRRLCPWAPIFSGNREISLYLYRYLFVKTLIDEGLTYAQVASLLGHRTDTPVYLYANAVLTSTYEIPYTPPDIVNIGGVDYHFVLIGNKFFIDLPLRFFVSGMTAKSLYNNSANDLLWGKYYSTGDLALITANLPAGWRIPTVSDIGSLTSVYPPVNTCNRHFKIVDGTFWVTPSNNLNTSMLNLKGSGQYYYSNLFSFKTNAQLWTSTKPNSSQQTYTWTRNNIEGFFYSNVNIGVIHFMPVIICKDA